MDLARCFTNCSLGIRLLLEGQPTKLSGYCWTLSRGNRALLNPKIDRELSTICLKCLEKDPQRRYSSALALAEDLEHWLKHEPIQAQREVDFSHTPANGCDAIQAPLILVTLLVALAVGLSVSVWNRDKPAVPIQRASPCFHLKTSALIQIMPILRTEFKRRS